MINIKNWQVIGQYSSDEHLSIHTRINREVKAHMSHACCLQSLM